MSLSQRSTPVRPSVYGRILLCAGDIKVVIDGDVEAGGSEDIVSNEKRKEM
jgi:hypothetical protein